MKAKPQTQTSSRTTSQKVESPDGLQEQIRRRAYEIYEQRGRENGQDVEDWLQSESEIIAVRPTNAA
jgi:hypothetical protein